MTEEEARCALFKLHQEYMKHTPKERLELYDDYQKNRCKIRDELIRSVSEKKEGKVKVA